LDLLSYQYLTFLQNLIFFVVEEYLVFDLQNFEKIFVVAVIEHFCQYAFQFSLRVYL